MNKLERVTVITEIARRDANIGKTAMMKFLYLLQTVFSVPLGYDFEIYTYGPYSQAVMSDIEFAYHNGNIRITPVEYPNGMCGYQINAEDSKASSEPDYLGTDKEYERAIDSVVSFLSRKSAKELELFSTIVFVFDSFKKNGWEQTQDVICTTVKSIKPHFALETIQSAYDELHEMKYIG